MQSWNMMKLVKIASIMISFIFCLLGVSYLILPSSFMQTKTICMTTFLVFGLIKIIGYASKDLYELAFQYDFEIGMILCLIGLLIKIHKGDYLSLMCIVFGIYLVMDSLFKMRISLDAKDFGIPTWYLTIGLALCCIGIAVVLTFRMLPNDDAMIRVLGISFLMEALMNLQTMMSMVKIIKEKNSNGLNNYEKESEE